MVANTTVPELIEQLCSGAFDCATSSTESDWYALWANERLGELDHLGMAIVGGAMADRLPWVFLSGYQGMMRHAFPFCPLDGWASYLVSEDRSGELPGATLTRENGRPVLSGHKTWVAASDHIDHLIVKVSAPSGEAMVVVGRDAPGVSLSTRPRSGFLGDMSQGAAAFESVSVDEEHIFSNDDLPSHFSPSEPHHVLAAMNAFMASHTLRLGGESGIVDRTRDSLVNAFELMSEDLDRTSVILGLAELDRATDDIATEFEALIQVKDLELHARWETDRRLVNMFSGGLRKRADRLVNR